MGVGAIEGRVLAPPNADGPVVVDAKWKVWTRRPTGAAGALPLSHLTADLYQVAAYCRLWGAREAHLVYLAEAGAQTGLVHQLEIGGAVINVHAVDVAAEPAQILQAARLGLGDPSDPVATAPAGPRPARPGTAP